MHGDQVIQQQQRTPHQRQLGPQRRRVQSVRRQNQTAHQQHHEPRYDDNAEAQQRQYRERNRRLRQHCRHIGHRQRLPEKYAAIFSLALQRIETIKKLHDHRYHHDCRRYVFDRRAQALHLRGIRNRRAHLRRQMHRVDQKAEQRDPGRRRRRNINRPVLE